jgi:putative FmdB family regulatory protein
VPIYAYRCSNCGHQEDVLQKITDPLLTQCPACGQSTYVKQVTAAGFQLKGSGWYVTDFRDNKSAQGASAAKKDVPAEASASNGGDKGQASESKEAGSSATASAPADAKTTASTPAASSKTGTGAAAG